MLVSAVILSYNSAAHLDRCITRLAAALQAFDEPSEILVVENGSADGSADLLRKLEDGYSSLVTGIYFETNQGTTRSRNVALKRASGDYLLILDSDAYIDHEALSGLIQHLKLNPRTGIAVPRLLYGSGNFQLSCDVFPTLWQKFVRFLFLKRIEEGAHALEQATEPVNVDYAISACWLMRRSILQKVGYFDERIFYSPEDVDYCIRVWANDLSIQYVPDLTVVHDAQELSRGFRLSAFHISHLKGLFYLFWKHAYIFRAPLYRRIKRFG